MLYFSVAVRALLAVQHVRLDALPTHPVLTRVELCVLGEAAADVAELLLLLADSRAVLGRLLLQFSLIPANVILKAVDEAVKPVHHALVSLLVAPLRHLVDLSLQGLELLQAAFVER